MSEEQTMVQKAFAQIGERFDGIEKLLKREKPLPYDAQIEYLESTGTQYIDTEIDVVSSHKFQYSTYFALVKRRDPNENNYLFSCSNTSGWLTFEIDRVSPYRAYANLGTKTLIYCGPSPYPFNSWDTVTVASDPSLKQYSITDSNWSTSGSFSGTLPNGRINLLTGRGLTTTSMSFVKIGYVKIWDNDILVRDFIPVRLGNVGYLYDKVSGQLFGNQGTGSFVLGPDKS